MNKKQKIKELQEQLKDMINKIDGSIYVSIGSSCIIVGFILGALTATTESLSLIERLVVIGTPSLICIISIINLIVKASKHEDIQEKIKLLKLK